MKGNFGRPTFTIGTREIALVALGLSILAVGVFIFVVGAWAFDGTRALPQPVAAATTSALIESATPTSVLGPTLEPTYRPSTHVVQPGENLTAIAALYSITLEMLQQANGITDPNAIYAGQILQIPALPASTSAIPTTAPAPTPTLPPDVVYQSLRSGWPRSTIEGDLEANYPLVVEHPRFRLHYQPNTYPDLNLETLVGLIQESLSRVETRLGVRLEGTFDVYVAGTLFEDPDASLRGRSFSRDRRLFFLYDGSGTSAENAYLVTHELTHLIAWNTWGPPSSTMISEGLATYVGRYELESGGFMNYDQLCLGAYAVGQMASMAAIENEPDEFQGHIQHRFNYFGSACFVEYLVNTYGLGPLSRLYSTSEYEAIYGRSLSTLDADWKARMESQLSGLVIDPVALMDYTREVTTAYDYVFAVYDGTTIMHAAYVAIDRARIALWQGDYEATRRWLEDVYSITGFRP